MNDEAFSGITTSVAKVIEHRGSISLLNFCLFMLPTNNAPMMEALGMVQKLENLVRCEVKVSRRSKSPPRIYHMFPRAVPDPDPATR